MGHFELGEMEVKELVQEGVNIKDVIKLGRRGVCPSAVEHIKKRWNTSRVRLCVFYGLWAYFASGYSKRVLARNAGGENSLLRKAF